MTKDGRLGWPCGASGWRAKRAGVPGVHGQPRRPLRAKRALIHERSIQQSGVLRSAAVSDHSLRKFLHRVDQRVGPRQGELVTTFRVFGEADG